MMGTFLACESAVRSCPMGVSPTARATGVLGLHTMDALLRPEVKAAFNNRRSRKGCTGQWAGWRCRGAVVVLGRRSHCPVGLGGP